MTGTEWTDLLAPSVALLATCVAFLALVGVARLRYRDIVTGALRELTSGPIAEARLRVSRGAAAKRRSRSMTTASEDDVVLLLWSLERLVSIRSWTHTITTPRESAVLYAQVTDIVSAINSASVDVDRAVHVRDLAARANAVLDGLPRVVAVSRSRRSAAPVARVKIGSSSS